MLATENYIPPSPSSTASRSAGQSMLGALLSGVSRKAARHHRSKPFRMQNRGPLVSYTFDDVPDSAFTNGATILEEFGARGTYYIAAGTCGMQDEYWRVIDRHQVRELHERGHEIGCHTASHVNVETLDAAAMEAECRRNGELLHEICGELDVTNFCFPFGRLSLPRKLQLQKRFDTCRGIYEGINFGTIDLGLLRVIELYDRTLTQEKLEHALRTTRDNNGWLIFYTHDVADPPSWIGSSTKLLRSTLAAVEAMNMPVVPLREAVQAIGYRG